MSKNITKIIEHKGNTFAEITNTLIRKHDIDSVTNNPDVKIIGIEEKQSIGIEQVKELRQWAYLRPFQEDKKIIVIEKADYLTIEAQNSILKLIEEPPYFIFIYLIVKNHKTLLTTILSRGSVIKDNGINNEDKKEILTFLELNTIGKFKIIEDIAKRKKNEIIEFIDILIMYLRGQGKSTILIEEIINIRKNLIKNVNKKLALDNLIISLDNHELD